MTQPSAFKRLAGQEFFGPFLALLIISLFVALTTPSFLDPQNFRNIALQVSILSIVAIGSTIVIITGGIDLSPGSMIAFLTMCLAVFIKNQGMDLGPAIALTLLIGCALGIGNGILVAYVGIPAFIVTLAGLSAFKGLALTLNGGTPAFSLSEQLGQVFYGTFLGLPLPFFYVIGSYLLFMVIMEHTRLGREIYAVGGNENAARLSGINVARVRLIAFSFAGACAAFGAVLLAARLNSGSPNYGANIELQAIAAAVVGGASLAGGRGRVVSSLIGSLIIVVVQNGLNLNAVTTSMQSLTIGLIILIAVGLDVWRARLGRGLARLTGQRTA
ncbi:ribose transport system permease protein [Gemmobacter aquatilis]|uniref:Ribose transport system permease protein n=1 Tax=Gemmobacter aquatilis TaxID=933059 RepID=A0A1H8MVG3_9RHOB|nr:ABC transporter permease [Gemmobacter aquatilis]SEO21372.1 ribose transport system permease protein [Gemmobacter aquatilis]